MSRHSTKQDQPEDKANSISSRDVAGMLRRGMYERLAYSVDELVDVLGLSRGFIFIVMDDGRLVAHKADGRTIVLRDDAVLFLRALPIREPKKAPPTSSDVTTKEKNSR